MVVVSGCGGTGDCFGSRAIGQRARNGFGVRVDLAGAAVVVDGRARDARANVSADFSAPHPMARQLPAIWLAGVLVALLTGCGFGLRILLAGNIRGAMAWLIGALFIPTFALSLGVWSGTGKPFEILYTLLWYIGPLHAMPTLDFMGSAPATAATRYPLIYLGVAGVMAVAALAGRKRQLQS